MALYDPRDDDLIDDIPVDVALSVDDTGDIPDNLYDYLLDQFILKAKAMGHDVVNTPDLVLSEWTIKARLTRV